MGKIIKKREGVVLGILVAFCFLSMSCKSQNMGRDACAISKAERTKILADFFATDWTDPHSWYSPLLKEFLDIHKAETNIPNHARGCCSPPYITQKHLEFLLPYSQKRNLTPSQDEEEEEEFKMPKRVSYIFFTKDKETSLISFSSLRVEYFYLSTLDDYIFWNYDLSPLASISFLYSPEYHLDYEKNPIPHLFDFALDSDSN